MSKAIIIFARNPVAGKVKTRIAATAGNEKALEIYTHLLFQTHACLETIKADKFVFYSDEIITDDIWQDDQYKKSLQQGATLGERMCNAFASLINKYGKIIIIGTDCPALTEQIIDAAFYCLERSDIVIGPAADGGYYLLGMKKEASFLFENKEWSTDSVYAHTITDIKKHQLSYNELIRLPDIDTEKDWNNYLSSKKDQR